MNDVNQPDVEAISKQILQAFAGVLSWQWDARFETVLAQFGADGQTAVRSVLERYLSHIWDVSSISSAPDIVRAINIRVVGLRSQQLLFTSDPDRESLIFGAWWPWGDGETISIRMAPWYKKLPDSERAKKIQLFKSWFGV